MIKIEAFSRLNFIQIICLASAQDYLRILPCFDNEKYSIMNLTAHAVSLLCTIIFELFRKIISIFPSWKLTFNLYQIIWSILDYSFFPACEGDSGTWSKFEKVSGPNPDKIDSDRMLKPPSYALFEFKKCTQYKMWTHFCWLSLDIFDEP